MMRAGLVLLLLSTALAGALPGQSALDRYLEMPDDYQEFWRGYRPAREADDESAMDKAVRVHRAEAEGVLDLWIADICKVDVPELHHELRTLAWSLDRAEGQTRYIERVRGVLDLDVAGRRTRAGAIAQISIAYELLTEARTVRSEAGWSEATRAFDLALKGFEAIGDREFSVYCLQALSEIEDAQGRPWERGRLLVRLVAAGDELAYKDALVEQARSEIARLIALGIDPHADKPAEVPVDPEAGEEDGAGAEGGGKGRGLTSFLPGSIESVSEFELVVAKKGITGVTLPSFAPPEQYLLWNVTWLDKDGPSAWDSDRHVRLAPFGAELAVTREGSTFGIDSDGDGRPDVTCTPSSTPQLIEVPDPAGGPSWPLMIAVPGDRETMFGLDLNYSPQPEGARVRFHTGHWMEGEAADEILRLYDSNLSGKYGDVFEYWEDRVTLYEEEDPTIWFETDAVLVGKAKTALPWSSVLPVGGTFWRTGLDPDGRRLTLREMNLETGFVKLDLAASAAPAHIVIRETGKLEGAFFDVVPAKKGGVVEVPAGTYELSFGRLASGTKTGMKQARMYRGRAAPFEVAPGATHVLSLGAPYDLRLLSSTDGKEEVVDGLSLRIHGRGGEEWAMIYDDQLLPEVELRNADGKRVGKAVKMMRPDIEAWQTGKSSTIWFPLSARIERKGEGPFTLHATAKSHPLLGGPFTTPEPR